MKAVTPHVGPFLPTLLALASGFLISCQNTTAVNPSKNLPPLQAMKQPVDLDRFMGDWHVIGNIPTFIEKEAYNAVENYKLDDDGSIATTFTFNKGSSDGPVKTYHPRGFVHNHDTRAEWRMRFVWPFKSAYLILLLDGDYQTTVVGVPNRKHAWIMSRSKTLPAARYEELVRFLHTTGHDVSKLRKVPQQ